MSRPAALCVLVSATASSRPIFGTVAFRPSKNTANGGRSRCSTLHEIYWLTRKTKLTTWLQALRSIDSDLTYFARSVFDLLWRTERWMILGSHSSPRNLGRTALP